MSRRGWARVETVLLRGVPHRNREAVSGDLIEAGPAQGPRRLLALAGIVFHAQVEPWRQSRTRLAAASLVLTALVLLQAIPASAGLGAPDPAIYSGPILELATALWRSDHLVAAAAAGLVLGHAPGIPPWADAARGHGAALLTLPALALAPGAVSASATAGVLWAAVWFGARAARARPG